MNKLVYTPKDVQQMLILSKSTVYNLLKSGEIPSVSIGKSLRIPVTEFNEWCNQKGIKLMTGENQK